MVGPWRALSQVIGDRRMYIAGRQLDETQPLHAGNVEHSGGYLEDRDAVMQQVAVLNGLGSIGLKTVPTHDLVAELARREGVSQYIAGPQDRYLVRVKTIDAVTTAEFDLGPATILVVVD